MLDTNSLIKNLEQRGFSRAQAKAITDALKELDASSLVTESHLSDAVHVLQVDFEKALHHQTWVLVGVVFAQGAFIIIATKEGEGHQTGGWIALAEFFRLQQSEMQPERGIRRRVEGNGGGRRDVASLRGENEAHSIDSNDSLALADRRDKTKL